MKMDSIFCWKRAKKSKTKTEAISTHLGTFFDKDGFDAVGGQYDKEGYYIRPAQENFAGYYYDDLEDYDLNDDEEDQEQGSDQLEKEAMMQEHVMPA